MTMTADRPAGAKDKAQSSFGLSPQDDLNDLRM